MSFHISEQKSNGFGLVVLEDNSNNTRISILPQYGALLHEVILESPTGDFNFIDNYETISDLETELKRSYKGCKLSPFVCRIANGEYEYDGKRLSFLERHYDNSAIHGLLYDKQFDVSDMVSDDSSAAVTFTYHYKKKDPGYPFTYKCVIRYTLLPANMIRIDTNIINLDDVSIPLADGWHPYFALGGLVDDWLLRFRAESMVGLNEKLVPTGELTPYTSFQQEKPINITELDNCFLLDNNDDVPACTLVNPSNKSSVVFFPDKSYPYLQLYIPPSRKSIAIENLSAAPDCFNNHMGLTMLAAGQSRLFSLQYRFAIQK